MNLGGEFICRTRSDVGLQKLLLLPDETTGWPTTDISNTTTDLSMKIPSQKVHNTSKTSNPPTPTQLFRWKYFHSKPTILQKLQIYPTPPQLLQEFCQGSLSKRASCMFPEMVMKCNDDETFLWNKLGVCSNPRDRPPLSKAQCSFTPLDMNSTLCNTFPVTLCTHLVLCVVFFTLVA